MRKIYTSVLLLLISFAARAQFPVPYCAEAFASGVEPITNVTFAGINNPSVATTGTAAHQDFTSIVGAVQQGSSYLIEVQGNTDGNFISYIRLFADWNNDNDFLDASESYEIGTITNSTGADGKKASATILVPSGATLGSTRIRVIKKYSVFATPCNTLGFGQAEDYTVTVSVGSACTGTPTGGSITPTTSLICTSSTVTLTSNAANIGLGNTYQWQSSPAGANTFTNISGATANTYTTTVSASTDFRVIITCGGSGLTGTSTVATVTLSGPPSNDSVCFALPLTLDGPSSCGNTTCATGYGTATIGVPGNPAFTNSTPNNTVWYTYTPTTTGPVQAKFKRPAGVTTGFLNGWLGIYTVTGACPYTFTQVPSTLSYNLATSDSVSVITPSLTAGTTYYLMIDGNTGAFGAFCIQLLTPPPLPTCSNLFLPTNGNTSAENLFTLTWSKSANATSYDVYINTTTPPTLFGNVVDTSLTLSSTVAGTTFYWYVVPRNATGAATGCNSNIFSFTTSSAPANDSCGAAISLLNGSAINGAITGATPSPALSITCGSSSFASANDVWYRINALSNGTATVSVSGNYGTGFNPVIAAYSGTCNAPVLISCSDASSTTTETINLTNLVAGNSYLIRIFANGTVANGGLTITATGPALPVTGVVLSGARSGSKAQLSWKTLTEINNAGFELQRSADGKYYSGIANIASKANGGNSNAALNYNADDTKPFSGANYYRLKQTDKDGKISYSNIVYLKGMAVSNLTLSALYPNPTRDVLKAAIQAPVAESITFVVMDMMGKTISRQVFNVISGDNTINIHVANLPSGSYLLKAICRNGCETAYQKFTKQ